MKNQKLKAIYVKVLLLSLAIALAVMCCSCGRSTKYACAAVYGTKVKPNKAIGKYKGNMRMKKAKHSKLPNGNFCQTKKVNRRKAL